MLENYKKEIEELKEKLTPTTPRKFWLKGNNKNPASGSDAERS
jgi:hypothetical protein